MLRWSSFFFLFPFLSFNHRSQIYSIAGEKKITLEQEMGEMSETSSEILVSVFQTGAVEVTDGKLFWGVLSFQAA